MNNHAYNLQEERRKERKKMNKPTAASIDKGLEKHIHDIVLSASAA